MNNDINTSSENNTKNIVNDLSVYEKKVEEQLSPVIKQGG
jgi:hypothetical protein